MTKREKNLLKCLRVRSKSHGWDYDLDVAWLRKKLSSKTCEVTGLNLKRNYLGVGVVGPFHPSIDRIDSSKGYTKGNCQVVCHIYNVAKSEFEKEILDYWLQKFVEMYEKIKKS